ncbi:MAG: tRNA1(Val) (adenine(37)-N6)-methyltransferase [Hyphomicrobium sp.]
MPDGASLTASATLSVLKLPDGDFTDDAFLDGRLTIRQPARGYRAGVDAVLLAAAATGFGGAKVLDAGAGVGTVGLCIAASCADAHVVLVERETPLLDLAQHNIDSNGLGARVCAVAADVAMSPSASLPAALATGSFDVVVANPPYHDRGAGTPAGSPLKAASHAMPAADLDDWLRFLARMAAPSGRAIVVHKAESLGRLLAAFNGRFGAIRVLPIHPRMGDPAHRILMTGVKGSRAPMELLSGVVLHAEGGRFTPEAQAIFRDGAPLTMG